MVSSGPDVFAELGGPRSGPGSCSLERQGPGWTWGLSDSVWVRLVGGDSRERGRSRGRPHQGGAHPKLQDGGGVCAPNSRTGGRCTPRTPGLGVARPELQDRGVRAPNSRTRGCAPRTPGPGGWVRAPNSRRQGRPALGGPWPPVRCPAKPPWVPAAPGCALMPCHAQCPRVSPSLGTLAWVARGPWNVGGGRDSV